MAGAYTEDSYEKSVVELFQNMGYTHVYGPDVERDYHLRIYEDEKSHFPLKPRFAGRGCDGSAQQIKKY